MNKEKAIITCDVKGCLSLAVVLRNNINFCDIHQYEY